jgi:hypothetical protein
MRRLLNVQMERRLLSQKKKKELDSAKTTGIQTPKKIEFNTKQSLTGSRHLFGIGQTSQKELFYIP